MISALLLAAGAGTRFGGQKLLADVDGKPLVRWSAEALRQNGIGEIVVVVPPEHAGIQEALEGIDARLVINPAPARGMGSSIAAGVAALGADTRAALLTLADEPRIDPAVIRDVLSRYRTGTADIVAVRYQGVRGHPVLFRATIFAELRALDDQGDRGAKSVVDRDPERVEWLELATARPIDVDERGDLVRLASR